MWNYSRHLFYSNRLRLILEPLSTIFSAMRKIGHERFDFREKSNNIFLFFSFSEILLLVNLAVSLSTAHINPLPLSPDEIRAASNVETTAAALAPGTDKKKSNQKTDQTPNPSTLAATTVSSAMIVKSEDLRTALDVTFVSFHLKTNENQNLYTFLSFSRFVNMLCIKQTKLWRNRARFQLAIDKLYYNCG